MSWELQDYQVLFKLLKVRLVTPPPLFEMILLLNSIGQSTVPSTSYSLSEHAESKRHEHLREQGQTRIADVYFTASLSVLNLVLMEMEDIFKDVSLILERTVPFLGFLQCFKRK